MEWILVLVLVLGTHQPVMSTVPGFKSKAAMANVVKAATASDAYEASPFVAQGMMWKYSLCMPKGR